MTKISLSILQRFLYFLLCLAAVRIGRRIFRFFLMSAGYSLSMNMPFLRLVLFDSMYSTSSLRTNSADIGLALSLVYLPSRLQFLISSFLASRSCFRGLSLSQVIRGISYE